MKTACLKPGSNYGKLKKKAALDFARVLLTSYGAHDHYGRHYHENPYLSLLVAGPYTEKNSEGTRLLRCGEIIFRPAAYDHTNAFMGEPGLCFNIGFKDDWKQWMEGEYQLPGKAQVYACGAVPARGGTAYAHIMYEVADKLTPEQMRDVALYYESLTSVLDLPAAVDVEEKVR